MATMTLAELEAATRQRADQVNSEFCSSAEVRQYLNQSLAELHGLIVQAFGEDYFLTTSTLSYAANVETADLPSDFFKVRGVDVLVQSGTPNRYATLRQFNWNTRNVWNTPGATQQGVVNGWWSNLQYRVYQDKLILTPPPGQATTVRLWYIPEFTELVDDADETAANDSLNGWLEYAIVDAAIKMRDKQETDTSVLREQRDKIAKRIESEAANRDAGDAETIRDVNATGNDGVLGWYGVM